jgi:hypothetical protein
LDVLVVDDDDIGVVVVVVSLLAADFSVVVVVGGGGVVVVVGFVVVGVVDSTAGWVVPCDDGDGAGGWTVVPCDVGGPKEGLVVDVDVGVGVAVLVVVRVGPVAVGDDRGTNWVDLVAVVVVAVVVVPSAVSHCCPVNPEMQTQVGWRFPDMRRQ